MLRFPCSEASSKIQHLTMHLLSLPANIRFNCNFSRALRLSIMQCCQRQTPATFGCLSLLEVSCLPSLLMILQILHQFLGTRLDRESLLEANLSETRRTVRMRSLCFPPPTHTVALVSVSAPSQWSHLCARGVFSVRALIGAHRGVCTVDEVLTFR